MPSSETLRLTVVRKVVLVFVGDDLRRERGSQQGAGDRWKRRGLDDGRAGFVGLVNEFLADGAPPEDLGLDDIEFVVMLFADLGPLAGIGKDLVGDEDSFNEDPEVLREAVGLAAAVVCGFWFSLLRCGCFAAIVRRRAWLSHDQLVEEQLELGGVDLFGTRPEDALAQAGDDLVLALQFELEEGVLGFERGQLLLRRLEAGEDLLKVLRTGVGHG